jgi:hypothetical protein
MGPYRNHEFQRQLGLHLRDSQSAEEFMVEVEKKVNAMISEYTMNEYKAYKNQVFSEIC